MRSISVHCQWNPLIISYTMCSEITPTVTTINNRVLLASVTVSYTHLDVYKRQVGGRMKDYIEKRAVELAQYIVENNATVRKTAKIFNISKSTVQMCIRDRFCTKQNPK